MLNFTSTADLSRLHIADPAHPVISTLTNNLNTDPITIALLQPGDTDHPLAELCNAEDVSLEGVIEQGGVFLIVFETDYGYGIIFVVPNAEWLDCELRNCIEQNLYN